MQDRPDSAALLDAVEALLRDEIVPALNGALSYHARVAASVVAIVARELRLGPAAMADEQARLTALLGAEGDVTMHTATLAARLRDGTLSFGTPGVAEHLWATTRAKLAIDQPRYPRLQQLDSDGGR